MRTIIYTGKGGVGKTSLAAATALASAAHGHRTLVMSTDSAHSLGDSLQVSLGRDPTKVTDRLWGQEIDVLAEMERHWAEISNYLTALLQSQGVEEITAKEVVVIPGMELIAALLLLERYEREKSWDVAIVDTAPTADTLRLLSFPDAVQWYFDRFFKLEKRMMKVARPTVGRLMRTPLPSDRFFESLEDLYLRFRRVRNMLSDPDRTSVRLVLNPERMVITETQRAYTYLCLFGLPIEMLVVNRVFSDQLDGKFFEQALAEQKANLGLIEEYFGGVPMRRSPRYPHEVLGLERLRRLGTDVFDAEDPTRIFARAQPVRFFSRSGKKYVKIELPFAGEEALEVSSRGDTLYVKVGWYRRTLLLPYAYIGAKLGKAVFSGGSLLIEFLPSKEVPQHAS
ncbi:MAG: ArsA family ATPase [Euryarchaeota archaeon]|nr:ArsA family ATPase [Euryarchaeota archaeon]MDE1836780.1 ArsA family ATPase [Euryarchaeota archaeon]MDE1879798.1 ArsA family ATPase [Euryarchaeota archaeon]MDE2044764.1 ArsA family ATPase [Thermoplasmata archaeon]